MAPESKSNPPKRIQRFKHWLLHKMHWNPCDLLEVIHEPTCPGFCALNPPDRNRARCKVKLKLRSRCCGKIEVI